MLAMLNNPRREGLFANIALFVGGALAVNALIFAAGWNARGDQTNPPLIPPGAVVGAIWVALFALMAVARWFYIRETTDRGWRALLPAALALICLAFPFYTAGLDDRLAGFWGSVATLLVGACIAALLWRQSARAGLPLVPTLAWLGFVVAVMLAYGF